MSVKNCNTIVKWDLIYTQTLYNAVILLSVLWFYILPDDGPVSHIHNKHTCWSTFCLLLFIITMVWIKLQRKLSHKLFLFTLWAKLSWEYMHWVWIRYTWLAPLLWSLHYWSELSRNFRLYNSYSALKCAYVYNCFEHYPRFNFKI